MVNFCVFRRINLFRFQRLVAAALLIVAATAATAASTAAKGWERHAAIARLASVRTLGLLPRGGRATSNAVPLATAVTIRTLVSSSDRNTTPTKSRVSTI